MKRSISMLLTCTAAVAAAGAARADGEDPVPNLPVPVATREVFVPVGFDSNDEAIAVVYGYLPGSCFNTVRADAKFDEATKTFSITQFARKVKSDCFDILVPFTTEVPLGVLKSGTYQVASRAASSDTLVVKPAATTAVDDYLYAPVSSIHVERADASGRYVAVIDGLYTNTCMAWDRAEVTDHGKTLEVMPILAPFQDGAACQFSERSFEERVPLPATLAPGHHLLHVRSLGGKSLSVVFSVAQ